jgi:hypothetical protein
MRQEEYFFKLKTMIDEEKYKENQTKFLEGNIVQDNESSK